jgi:hypothetical protein
MGASTRLGGVPTKLSAAPASFSGAMTRLGGVALSLMDAPTQLGRVALNESRARTELTSAPPSFGGGPLSLMDAVPELVDAGVDLHGHISESHGWAQGLRPRSAESRSPAAESRR